MSNYSIVDILSILSIMALIPLLLQISYVAILSKIRLKIGYNGYTRAIFYSALAGVLYMLNDALKASSMAFDYISNRGLVNATGSLLVRIIALSAITYLIYVMHHNEQDTE